MLTSVELSELLNLIVCSGAVMEQWWSSDGAVVEQWWSSGGAVVE